MGFLGQKVEFWIFQTLKEISNNPTVSDDDEFESKLKTMQEKVDILLEDARAGAGGGDLTLVEKVNDMHAKLDTVSDMLAEADRLQGETDNQIEDASVVAKEIENTIALANKELTVRFFEKLPLTVQKLILKKCFKSKLAEFHQYFFLILNFRKF